MSATASQGSCGTPPAAHLSCNLGAVASGDAATLTITMQRADRLHRRRHEPATATSSTPDPDTANNTANVRRLDRTPQADISITKIGPDTVMPARTITYRSSSPTPVRPRRRGRRNRQPSRRPDRDWRHRAKAAALADPPITCTLGTVPAARRYTITIIAHVDPATDNGDVLDEHRRRRPRPPRTPPPRTTPPRRQPRSNTPHRLERHQDAGDADDAPARTRAILDFPVHGPQQRTLGRPVRHRGRPFGLSPWSATSR